MAASKRTRAPGKKPRSPEPPPPKARKTRPKIHHHPPADAAGGQGAANKRDRPWLVPLLAFAVAVVVGALALYAASQ